MTEPQRPDWTGGSGSADAVFEAAVAAHEAGRLEEADWLYREVIRLDPTDAAAHELLGQVLISRDDHAGATAMLRRATELDAGSWGAWLSLSSMLAASGRLEEATDACRRALAIDAELPGIRIQWAVLAAGRGDLDAMATTIEGLAAEPALEEPHLRLLADLARRADRTDLLLLLLERLAILSEEECEELFARAGTAWSSGRREEVERLLALLHRHRPGHPKIASNLAGMLHAGGRGREAVEVLRRAVAANPDATDLAVTLAALCAEVGDDEGARQSLAAARARGGDGWSLRLASAASRLRPCYRSESELLEAASAVEREVREAEESLAVSDRGRALQALDALQRTSFFRLPALGLDVRATAESLGRIVTRTIAALSPESVVDAPSPSGASDGRLRVGVLSGFFRTHSNWKSHLSWLAHLDRSRFEVTAYSTRPAAGRERDEAKRRFERFVDLEGGPLDAIRRLREERLDAIVIPEVGMDPITRVVAAARLAPVQLGSWGHAVTSGYRFFTGFLSSALMEPAEADEHYSEPLVRLPGVGGSFEAPRDPPTKVGREAIGVRDREVAIWCAHAPFTHLPQHDSLYVRVAKSCPEARFVFVVPPDEPAFRQRLEQAFEREHLAPSTFLRFLPRMNPSEFLGANAACDLYLDTPEWSGCNTGLETILMGCPPITLPGRFMRGRHLWAFLQRMEMTDLAAGSIDAYAALAVEMVRSPDRRREARARLAERRQVLFGDPAPRIALERLIEESVTEAGGQDQRRP